MIRINQWIINPNQIIHVNLNCKKERVDGSKTTGVLISFTAPDNEIPEFLFFSGEEAEHLRKYFTKNAFDICSLEKN
jgi:hypothetical protein